MILGPQGPGKVGQRGGFSIAGVAQLVEHYLAKVDVASSNLVSRSTFPPPVMVGTFLRRKSRSARAKIDHLRNALDQSSRLQMPKVSMLLTLPFKENEGVPMQRPHLNGRGRVGAENGT